MEITWSMAELERNKIYELCIKFHNVEDREGKV
jgi:hypothetical protein